MAFRVHVLDCAVDAREHDRHPDAALQRRPLMQQRLVTRELAHRPMEPQICLDAVLEVGRSPRVHVVDGAAQCGRDVGSVG